MELAVGTVVAGRYRLDRILGTGGMGQVWAATHAVTGRSMALKFLHGKAASSPAARVRFEREARAAGSIDHPNVVAVHDFFDLADGTAVMVMDLLNGESLRKRLDRVGALPLDKAAGILGQVASAVGTGHAAGIIHRDLKPDNVFLVKRSDHAEEVKVLDFGIAKLLETDDADAGLTGTGMVMGTPWYMAPEQAGGDRDLDRRVDIWAIGVMLYECLAGRRPIRGENAGQILRAMFQETIVPLDVLVPGMPDDVVAITMRMLATNRDGRPSGLAEVLAVLALHTRAAVKPIPSKPPPPIVIAAAAESDGGVQLEATADASVLAPTVAATAKDSNEAEKALNPAGTLAPLGASSAHRTTRRWSRRARLLAAIGGISVGAIAAIGFYVLHRGSPLAPAASVLACPPLVASGAVAPSGWLGAAAADLACRRATLELGGRGARTLLPAELLDLPHEVSDAIVADVYSDPATRTRAIAAASQRADAWLDGDIAVHDDRFRVTLIVRARDGRELDRATGDEAVLHRAIRLAMDPLVKRGTIPRAYAIDPEVASWIDTTDPTTATALADLELSEQLTINLPDPAECDRVEERKAMIGKSFASLHEKCEEARHPGATPLAIAIDTSSPQAFAWTAPAALRSGTESNPTALADQAHAMLEQARTPYARAELAALEARLAYAAGDTARSRLLGIRAAHDDPKNLKSWQSALFAYEREVGADIAAHAWQAWNPAAPGAWNFSAISEMRGDGDLRVRYFERTVLLAPHQATFDQNLAISLLPGRREEARALAARLSAGDANERVTAEAILVRVEASEARFGKALARARAALAKVPNFGSGDTSEGMLLSVALDVGLITGSAEGIADDAAKRFVLADPTRLVATSTFTLYSASLACAFASHDTALACAERLRDLMKKGFFRRGYMGGSLPLFDGIDRYVHGDAAGVVAAWRPLTRHGKPSWLLGYIFERLEETDLAARVDESDVSHPGAFNGAALAYVREARRADKRGDHDRARELAKKVIDAWSSADVEVPAVAEMKALLAR